MEKRGRRFADEHEIIEFPAQEANKTENSDKADKAQTKREQKLKEKNAKKLEKMLKKQRKNDKRPAKDQDIEPDSEELEIDEYSEDEAPDEEVSYRSDKRSSKKKLSKKQIIAAVIIVVLLFGVVFFAANPERFSFESISNFVNYGILNNDSEEKFPLNIQGESITAGNFIRKGQNVCYSSDTRTQELNSYGKSVFSLPHAFIDPIVCTSQKKTLVYNLGSTGFQIIADKAIEFSDDTKDNILTADIIDSGVYALVTQSSGYLSKLYVYNEKNEQIFAYSFADYYVTSVSLNEAGDHAVVSGLSALNGMNICSLYLLDFTADTPVYFSEFENNIIYDVRYLNNKNACAVGKNASYVFNTSNGEVETFDYEGKALTAYDINTDTDTYTISISNSGDGRNCDIVSFNSAGKQDKSFTVEQKIIDLSSFKGRVALLTNDEVMLYSKDGKAYNSKTLRSDPHAVVMFTGSQVYVLCTGYIDTISL